MEHKSELREKLAELAHSQWSGWMDYLFTKCIDYNPDAVQAEEGAVIIPKWAVERWKGQAKAVYCELTAKEMDSDRTEADKFLAVFTACNEHDTLKAKADRLDYVVRLLESLKGELEIDGGGAVESVVLAAINPLIVAAALGEPTAGCFQKGAEDVPKN